MANTRVVPGQTITAAKENNVTTGDTAPTSPAEGDLWNDTTGAGTPILKTWDGAAWQTVIAGTSLIPSGLIAMWSGSLATIPAGWALCDGAGGRPDLRDKFVRGAAAGAGGGALGGADSITHSSGGSHTHSTAGGAHTHPVPLSGMTHDTQGSHGGHGTPTAAAQFTSGGASFTTPDTHQHDDAAGGHGHATHTGTLSATSNGDHSHSSTGTAHSDHGTHDNKPAYFAVLFIIKT